MNLSLFIAKRYLFSKKLQNVINIISAISISGIIIGSMALFTVLSVYNGFDSLIRAWFNAFDPDLKITINKGKYFSIDNEKFLKLRNLPDIAYFGEVVEENALLKYNDQQYVATIKGVSENFALMSSIEKKIIEGNFILKSDSVSYAVIGNGIAYYLSAHINYKTPIRIYLPKRSETLSLNPDEALVQRSIYPSGIFSIQQEIDVKYMLVPIEFARELTGYYPNEVTSIEIKLKAGTNATAVQKKISMLLGDNFTVANRYQQHEFLYKIMKSEKWAIFFILLFIIIIAAFNIIGSISMIIIDKKQDIITLRNLGAKYKTVENIFFIEGWMISFIGVIIGLSIGVLLCWLQMQFGFIKLQGSGSFIIDAYPVKMKLWDAIAVFVTVMLLGFVIIYYPVRYITKRYFY